MATAQMTPDMAEVPDSGIGDDGTLDEQAAAPEAVATPQTSKPKVDIQALQRYATQSQQRWGAVADALGLPKDVPVDVLKSRLDELRTPQGVDDEVVDPDTAKRLRRLEDREWGAEGAIYGEEAQYARSIFEKLRSRRDTSASDIMSDFHAAVEAALEARMASALEPSEEEQPQSPAEPFRQEAPIGRRTRDELDPAVRDLPHAEKEARVADWLHRLGIGG